MIVWVPGRSDPPKRFHGGKSTYQEPGIDTRITLQLGVTVQPEPSIGFFGTTIRSPLPIFISLIFVIVETVARSHKHMANHADMLAGKVRNTIGQHLHIMSLKTPRKG